MSGEPDADLHAIAQLIEHHQAVDDRLALERALGRLLDQVDDGAPTTPKTLDLVGHTRPNGLLALGDWVLDAGIPATSAFFRGLADNDVLPRLGVRALRLLGCGSAATVAARATLCALSELLDLEVYGATDLLYAAHYGASGFRDEWQFLLAAASDLRRGPPRDADLGDPFPRALDVDALPAVALGPAPVWPRHVIGPRLAQDVLALIRRDGGARMSGFRTPPLCELALPAAQPGRYHLLQVVLNGAFVRVDPEPPISDAGVGFPVDDAGALRALIAAITAAR